MDKNARIQAELEEMDEDFDLEELSELDQTIWKRQSLLLSHLREEGDFAEACKQAHVAQAVASTWYDDNTLGFRKRQDFALEQVGKAIAATQARLIMSGEQKSPTIIKLMMESYWPTVFKPKADAKPREGKSLLDLLREENDQHFDDHYQEQGFVDANDPAPPSDDDNVIDISQRRA